MYSKWDLKLSRESPALTDSPHWHENHSRILPVTRPCFSYFWAAEQQQHSPRFPKQHERPTTALRPCCCPKKDERWMEALPLANWCMFHPCRRDEMAEESKFLPSPLIYLQILWRGRKTASHSQSMSASNSQCSAEHLLTLAVSQD